MIVSSRRAVLASAAAALATAVFAGGALAQSTRDSRVHSRRDAGADAARRDACRPMCDMDPSPCDSPAQKAADGRCANPNAATTR